jgi:hypothetical protein
MASRKFSSSPLSGKRLKLIDRVQSFMKTQELAEACSAQEIPLSAPTPPMWEDLPPVSSPGWTRNVRDFSTLRDEVIEDYPKSLCGYSKNWHTGCGLIMDGHVPEIGFHNGTESIAFVKAKVKA